MDANELMHKHKKKCPYGRKKTGRKGCKKNPNRRRRK